MQYRNGLSRRVLISSLFFLLTAIITHSTPVFAAQLALTWADNSTNEDGFRIERKNGETGSFVQLASVGTNVTDYNDTTLVEGTTYCYRVSAYNSEGISSPSNEACGTTASSATPPPSTGSGAFSANAAGPQFTGADGVVYQADTDVTGGNTYSVTSPISGTADDTLYQSVRWGDFTYTIPLPSGNYLVTFKFAEIYYASVGSRVFNVLAEGKQVISNLDIFSQVGQNAAYDVDVPVAVTDGALNISFQAVVDYPNISAIKIISTESTSPPQTFTLQVGSNGSGLVSSSPTGIDCGATCSATYSSDATVTLTATPAAGSIFTGWSGDADCSDGQVTMNADLSCTATFALQPQTFTLTVAKMGNGAVTGAGINCGADCTESYLNGTTITLTAAPAAGSTFKGWQGGICSGTGSCTVTVTTDISVSAVFSSPLLVKIGVFRPSTGEWFLDLNGNGNLDDCTTDACLRNFGNSNELPIVGDWAGTDSIQIGVFDPKTGMWRLDRNGNDQWDDCAIDLCLGPFGQTGSQPIVGKWQIGISVDRIGVFDTSKRNSVWRLDANGNGNEDKGNTDIKWGPFGQADNMAIVSDWTGDGATKGGVFDPRTGLWQLDLNGNGKFDDCTIDRCFGPFGIAGDLPVAADWDGSGQARIGVFDPTTGLWELDLNNNGLFDGCQVDKCFGPFGKPGDLPIVGNW